MNNAVYYKGIQLPQLRSFCVAATRGNFAAAAQALGLSRPAVWQQVRALERELNVTLLRRRGRSVEVTPEGRLLLEIVQPHVNGLDSLRRLFEARQAQLQQHLTITSTHYLLSHTLTKPVREFRMAHPSVHLNLRPRSWPEVLRLVELGQADVGVLPYLPDAPRNGRLEYEHLFNLKFTLLTPTRHPLARLKRIRPSDLVRYPLIVEQDHAVLSAQDAFNQTMLERILRRHGVLDRLQVVLESPLVDIIAKYVAIDLGVAPLYVDPAAGANMPGVRLKYLHPQPDDLPAAMVVRKGAHLPECVRDFQAVARRLLASRNKR